MTDWLARAKAHKEKWQSANKSNQSLSKSNNERQSSRSWSRMIETDNNYLKAHYPDHGERNKHKPALLKKYQAYLKTVLASGDQTHNPVVVICAIWASDTNQFDEAIKLARFGKTMRTGFKRDLPTFVADAVMLNGDDADKKNVLDLIEQDEWSFNHVLLAKYYKWFAVYNKSNDTQLALDYARKAKATYDKAPVVNLIDELERLVKKQQAD